MHTETIKLYEERIQYLNFDSIRHVAAGTTLTQTWSSIVLVVSTRYVE